MRAEFNHDTAQVYIDIRIFPNSVIQKCLYWYTAEYDINYGGFDGECLEVVIKTKNGESFNKDPFLVKLSNDLNDFVLRDIVLRETKVIRELLVAKAFANFEEDEKVFQIDQIADPVGFRLGE